MLVVRSILLGALAVLFLWVPKIAQAAKNEVPPVIFHEIMWAGSYHNGKNDTTDEWLVLKNTTDELIDISGWYLTRQDSNEKYELSGVIAARGYFLVARKGDEESILAIEPDVILPSYSINNTDIKLSLCDSNGTPVDEVIDSGTPDAGSNTRPKASMVRDEDNGWVTSTGSANLDDGAEELATPGLPKIHITDKDLIMANGIATDISIGIEYDVPQEQLHFLVNGVEQQIDFDSALSLSLQCTSDGDQEKVIRLETEDGRYAQTSIHIFCYKFADIVINEVMPKPGTDYNHDGKVDTQDEWIELFNPTTSVINLRNWKIYDGTSSYTFDNDTIINAKSYLVLSKDTMGLSLNDDGESIQLVSPADEAVSDIAWQKADKGVSWAVFAGEYKWTVTPTPGAVNKYTSAESVEEQTNVKPSAENVDNAVVSTLAEEPLDVTSESARKVTTVRVIGGDKVLAAALSSVRLPTINKGVEAISNPAKNVFVSNDSWLIVIFGFSGLIVLARVSLGVVSYFL